MGKVWMGIFFIFVTVFNAAFLVFLTAPGTNTIGISGFALAIVSFFTLYLYSIKDQEYKWWVTAIIINIGIGFSAQISFVGHLFGAIGGGIFYFLYKLLKK